MHELINLINQYLQVGKSFLTHFFSEKKIKIPNSYLSWVATNIDQIGSLSNGTEYVKHGAGIKFKNKKWEIDIDFGVNGEWNGFDEWSLFSFLEDNKVESKFADDQEIRRLLEEGVENNTFIKKDELYFLNLYSAKEIKHYKNAN